MPNTKKSQGGFVKRTTKRFSWGKFTEAVVKAVKKRGLDLPANHVSDCHPIYEENRHRPKCWNLGSPINGFGKRR